MLCLLLLLYLWPTSQVFSGANYFFCLFVYVYSVEEERTTDNTNFKKQLLKLLTLKCSVLAQML